MELLRATETWQRAGAYYVRIQAMAKKHAITLPREFDEHDTPETKYILALDGDFPVGTARIYELDADSMMIGMFFSSRIFIVVRIPSSFGIIISRMTQS